jgi:predicted DNA-binding transcriptional regulator AlpA
MNNHDTARLLPETGYLRIRGILGDPKRGIPALLPISRSSWFQGIREGRYPKGVLLGPRTRAWNVESIKALIAEMSNSEATR